MNRDYLGARRYVYGALISDVPSQSAPGVIDDYAKIRAEMLRTVIRDALLTF